MKYKNKKIVLKTAIVCLFVFLLAVFLLPKISLAADASQGVDTGQEFARGIGLKEADPRIVVVRIIQVVLSFLSIMALVMVLYGGFIWMTSAGNDEKITQAKNILKNSIIGIVIILSSFAIVSFILNKLTTAGGGVPGGGAPPDFRGGISALGDGIIESVYPAPGETVDRNISLVVTFKEDINPHTICTGGNGEVCSGNELSTSTVKIFQQTQLDSCLGGIEGTCSLVAGKVYSKNKRTFVITPKEYLGSPSEYIWYYAYLGEGLEKANGEKAFGSFGDDYGWSFEVTNKLDLVPPQVSQFDIFPKQDNDRDGAGATSEAVRAKGKITILNPSDINTYSVANIANVQKANGATWPDADVIISEDCSDAKIEVVVANAVGSLTNSSGQLVGAGTISGDGRTINFSYCGLSLTLKDNKNFVDSCTSAACLWTINMQPLRYADVLTVGSVDYSFVTSVTGPNQILLARAANKCNLANSIINALKDDQKVNVNMSGGKGVCAINVEAKNAGNLGTSIKLSSNSAGLLVLPMSGGQDRTVSAGTPVGEVDQPTNSVIQINFNEAINPLAISGSATEIKNSLVVKCIDNPGNTVCDPTSEKFFYCDETNTDVCVAGNFLVSNQYRTVEFISNNKCGVNGCGESIYCLPESSHLRVELTAATLNTNCLSNDDCANKSPHTTCDNKVCKNGVNNYPLADPFSGVTDMALNSLDGNRNSFANGPAAQSGHGAYDENLSLEINGLNGDDYQWSFFISNITDTTPPMISETNPAQAKEGANLANSVKAYFNKMMMSSSLRAGSIVINNGQEDIEHQLIKLWNFANKSLGYWVTKNNNPEGKPAGKTMVEINHSEFSDATVYRSRMGSGIKDIYQNCYKPSSGLSCVGSPSCCEGVPSAESECK